MTYEPHAPMSPGFLHYFLDINRKNGYHCVFPVPFHASACLLLTVFFDASRTLLDTSWSPAEFSWSAVEDSHRFISAIADSAHLPHVQNWTLDFNWETPSAATSLAKPPIKDQQSPHAICGLGSCATARLSNLALFIMQYGWKLADKDAYISDTLRPPLFDGWTLRVFFYAANPIQSETAVQVGWNSVNPSKYVIRAEARGGRPAVTGRRSSTRIGDRFNANNIKQGEYFSLAIQIGHEYHKFRGLFDENTGHEHDMGSINTITKWHLKITPSLNIITSIHVYDAKGYAYPLNGLGSEFLINHVPLNVGSYGIFYCIYGNGWGELTIEFHDGNNRRSHRYSKTGLKINYLFNVYIRNTPAGWLIYADFQATPVLIVHEVYHDIISPIFTPAGILMMNMESSY
ncbi:uncharacterized protein [Dermacentor albipictus]|uniref:uncharacterized protein n=1 Tax=Dermacentor albipictus TaxID=60249 RepID=UPI0031FD7CF3